MQADTIRRTEGAGGPVRPDQYDVRVHHCPEGIIPERRVVRSLEGLHPVRVPLGTEDEDRNLHKSKQFLQQFNVINDYFIFLF